MDSDDEYEDRVEELLQSHPALLLLEDSGRVSLPCVVVNMCIAQLRSYW